jgi:predicted transcriptional regulator
MARKRAQSASYVMARAVFHAGTDRKVVLTQQGVMAWVEENLREDSKIRFYDTQAVMEFLRDGVGMSRCEVCPPDP